MMKCEGEFVFKGIETKEGGEFTNERGQLIKFSATNQIKLDEIVGTKTEERTFKFPVENKPLAEKFKSLKLYENVVVAFNIELYKTSVKLVPIDVLCEHEENEEG